jgi:hypothetical protein
MMDCTVSIVGQDGQTYTIDVQASSLFDAAAQAGQRWAMLWWYRSDAVIEVRAGRSDLEGPWNGCASGRQKKKESGRLEPW